jgi:hypothetical protein
MGKYSISKSSTVRGRPIAGILAIMALVLGSSACTLMAPHYTPSTGNVQSLRDGGAYLARVSDFRSEPGQNNENPLTIRGNTILSPYNGSYAGYLAEALRQELALAKKWSDSADTAITGTVLGNVVNAPVSSTGTVDIRVRFAVTRGSQKRYEQVKSVYHEFPSEFVGAIAIPRAVQEYQVEVQKLLGSLYGDQAFIAALKP